MSEPDLIDIYRARLAILITRDITKLNEYTTTCPRSFSAWWTARETENFLRCLIPSSEWPTIPQRSSCVANRKYEHVFKLACTIYWLSWLIGFVRILRNFQTARNHALHAVRRALLVFATIRLYGILRTAWATPGFECVKNYPGTLTMADDGCALHATWWLTRQSFSPASLAVQVAVCLAAGALWTHYDVQAGRCRGGPRKKL